MASSALMRSDPATQRRNEQAALKDVAKREAEKAQNEYNRVALRLVGVTDADKEKEKAAWDRLQRSRRDTQRRYRVDLPKARRHN